MPKSFDFYTVELPSTDTVWTLENLEDAEIKFSNVLANFADPGEKVELLGCFNFKSPAVLREARG